MNRDEEYDLLAEEQERMRQFELYRKLCFSVLLKRWRMIVLIFLVTLTGLAAFCQFRFMNSRVRYEARTGLFFYPKQTKRYGAMDAKQTLELFSRLAMRRQVADRLNLDGMDRATLKSRLEINQEKGRPNLIRITVKDAQPEAATLFANTVAEVCIDEYVSFRTDDLRNRLKTLEGRKRELEESVAGCEKEQRELVRLLNSMTPAQELERLRGVMSTSLASLSEINVQIANEEAKSRKFQEQLSHIDATALKHAAQLKAFQDEQERLKHEITRLRQLYTEKNPRLLAAVSEYDDALAAYRAYLKEKKIENYDPDALRMAESLQLQLADATGKLEFLKQNKHAFETEIARNRSAVLELTGLLPKYSELETRRESFIAILRTVEESISDLQLLIASTPSDIQQVEKVGTADAESAFGKKVVALILFLAFFVTGFSVLLLLAQQILFGRVESLEELAACNGLVPVGSYPASPELFRSTAEKEAVLHEIYYGFREALNGRHILFEGALEGGAIVPDIQESLKWNAAMTGMKLFQVNIVSARDFDPPADGSGGEALVAVQCVGQQGFLPVENLQALSPAELEMLGSDAKELLRNCDLLVLSRKEPLRQNDLFFRQMMEFSDCSLLCFGAGATSRRLLRHTVALQRACGHVAAVILTGVRKWTPAAGAR